MCDSLDCGVYYERRKVHGELAAAAALAQAGLHLLESEWEAGRGGREGVPGAR